MRVEHLSHTSKRVGNIRHLTAWLVGHEICGQGGVVRGIEDFLSHLPDGVISHHHGVTDRVALVCQVPEGIINVGGDGIECGIRLGFDAGAVRFGPAAPVDLGGFAARAVVIEPDVVLGIILRTVAPGDIAVVIVIGVLP